MKDIELDTESDTACFIMDTWLLEMKQILALSIGILRNINLN